ncbi:unnamed protein product, partial [Prorocentrum cordatum]
ADQPIFRSAAGIGALVEQGVIAPARPCWGPVLKRDLAARLDIVRRLRAVGLVGFRLGIRSRIGAFFVAKKGGVLRLVLDGREALRREGLDDDDIDPRGAGVDSRDGFYQFVDDDLADWFGFAPGAAAVFGNPDVYFPDSRSFGKVAPGWSLWFCQRVTESVQREAVQRLAGSAYPCATTENQHAPLFSGGRSLNSPCIDGASALAFCAADAGAALQEVCAELDRRQLACRERVEPESVGVILDGQKRRLRHAGSRAWKLYLGLQHLLGVPRVSLGWFDAELLDELRIAKGLISMAEVDRGAPWAPVAYCSDTSMFGYAVHEAALAADELLDAFSVRERRRFVDAEPAPPPGLEGPPPTAMGAGAEATAALHASLVGGPAFDCADDYLGPVADQVLRRDRWALAVRGAWRCAAPIHVKEVRAELLGLIRASRNARMHGRQVGSLGDDIAALPSFEKGRARDFDLRQLRCFAAARQIAADTQRRQRCVRSERNPADFDSRAADRGEVGPSRPQWGAPSAPAAVEASLGPPTPAAHFQPASAPAAGPVGSLPLREARGRLARVAGLGARRVGPRGRAAARASCPPGAPQRESRAPPSNDFPCAHAAQRGPRASAEAAELSPAAAQVLRLARRTVDLMELCMDFGAPWSLEDPAPSQMFSWGPSASCLASTSAAEILIHYCQCGCENKKPTLVITYHPDLGVVGRACPGARGREIREGEVSVATAGSVQSQWKTAFAGAYPPSLCRAWAVALGAIAPSRAWRRRGAAALSDHWGAQLAAAAGLGEDCLVRPWLALASLSARRNCAAPEVFGAWRRQRAADLIRPYLQTRRAKPITLCRRQDSCAKFKRWAQGRSRSLANRSQVGNAMGDYLDELYFAGKAAAVGRYAVRGAIHCMRLPRRTPAALPKSRDALAGWCQAGPERARDPLPREAAVLLADRVAQQGPSGLAAAGALVAGFDGYLRPSNVLKLTSGDVHIAAAVVGRACPRVTAAVAPLSVGDGGEPRARLKNNDHDMTLVFGDQASFKSGRAFASELLAELK